MSGSVRYSYVWWLVCDAVFDLTVRCSRPGDNVAAEFSAYNQTLSSHLRGQTPIDNLLNDFELVNFIQSKKLRRMRLIQEKTLQLSHHNMSAHNVYYVKCIVLLNNVVWLLTITSPTTASSPVYQPGLYQPQM